MSEIRKTLDRRTVMAGTGAVGALAAAAALLPGKPQATAAAPADAARPADSAGGYRLTEHVKQYYQTTRI